MKIERENDELVIKLPLKQPSYDALGQYIGETDNLVGIIAGDEYTISQLIDLGYKGDQQEGMPLVSFVSKEELKEACKIGGLEIWEHPLCAYCRKVIRGSFTVGDKGNMCFECELKEKD
jgi:hypothetical protein